MSDSQPKIVRPIAGSVTRHKIYCMFDNEARVIMRSYVRRKYGMSWDRYKEYCGLPDDYPYAAPAYLEEKNRGRNLEASGQKTRILDTPAFREEIKRFREENPSPVRASPSYPDGGGPVIVRPIAGSVTRDKIHCMFDNVARTHMAHYVLRNYGMSWDRYKEYCGLPDDYPKAAPSYMA